MSFIEAYKRLEKLCGDVLNNERKISAYIDEMKMIPQGRYLVQGWDEDLKKLKHYRWVRNQIAHTPDCTEANMCNSNDTQWILGFYARIMNQTDPLALYRKATQFQQKPIVNNTVQHYDQQQNYGDHSAANNQIDCLLDCGCGYDSCIMLCLMWLTANFEIKKGLSNREDAGLCHHKERLPDALLPYVRTMLE